ncbi:MAG: cytidine deaminase [Candidatus Pacebacteria bacterium CG_4_10_14_3_um_filter_34_15]|nr:MAG: hypothetical protein AUJ41_03260 [Candidatus Pacebacteria bacterium CG1_02_43_31]PIQ80567.1 MAG: cytidine deaminase [Candidatus Pacebacteria bacterium CG11_big_fil_rev_8_21_14_0_20_34_55]PIX81341.1 MAG: cytidine deaminase [Candidatus Pacebacteria bacterium CG_4_10_14_3_um_filter_34_15]
MKNKSLISEAKKLANKKELTSDVTVGHVGCALETKSGKIYSGLSVGTSANLGFCAEICAMAQMIKEGETEILEIIATEPDGKLITPCGRCREFMFQINRNNLKTKILLSDNKYITLEELLPHRWQDYWSKNRS